MKNLLECSIDELLTERQKAIETDNIARYRECNELISTWSENIAKKLEIAEMLNISIGTSKSNLAKAKGKLKNMFIEKYGNINE